MPHTVQYKYAEGEGTVTCLAITLYIKSFQHVKTIHEYYVLYVLFAPPPLRAGVVEYAHGISRLS